MEGYFTLSKGEALTIAIFVSLSIGLLLGNQFTIHAMQDAMREGKIYTISYDGCNELTHWKLKNDVFAENHTLKEFQLNPNINIDLLGERKTWNLTKNNSYNE